MEIFFVLVQNELMNTVGSFNYRQRSTAIRWWGLSKPYSRSRQKGTQVQTKL
jgi:hypothetical protein